MTVTTHTNSVWPALSAEQLKDKLDIVEVAEGLHGTLKTINRLYQGGHSPVHPSSGGQCLTIYPNTDSWFCFHCGLGGDVIDLIGVARFGLGYDRKTNFLEVLEEAARMVGVINSSTQRASHSNPWAAVSEKDTLLYALLTHSAEWFHQQLTQTPGILEFLKKNYGFSQEFIVTRKLGFAPLQSAGGENGLLEYLKKVGYTPAEAQAAAIVNKGGYCRYQGRIMFPYWQNNQVVYFAARATALTPKNEFETNANGEFKKYRKLKTRDEANPQISEAIRNDLPFGIDNLKLARKKGYVLITEGIPDQLAAEQAGEPAISPATTRFKAQQIQELAGLLQNLNIYLCFDHELNQAGENGAIETARVLEQQGHQVYLIQLPRPEGVEKIDLCDFIRDNGGEAIPALYRSALRLPDYLLEYRPVPARNEEKARCLSELAELAKICRFDRVSQEALQSRASSRFEVNLAVVRSIFKEVENSASRLQAEMNAEASEKKSQAEQVMDLFRGAELFHTAEQRAYISFQEADHFETWPIRSLSFKKAIRRKFFEQFQTPVKTSPVEDAISTLEALACGGAEIPVFGRLAYHQNAIYYDLTNPRWEVVKISAEGWEILANSPVKFRRTPGILAQVTPQKGGKLADLMQFVNVNPAEWKLLAGWLVTALNPDCQYPVLSLSGEQGSAKSTTSRFIRRLIDPSASLLRASPKDERDVWVSTVSNWVMAYDNLSSLPNWLSDAWCRIATGGGNATRMLYTDDEEVYFDARRPILTNGIDTIATRSDLLDRSLILTLPVLSEEARMSEKELVAEFEERLPYLLGGLFEAVSVALARYSSIKIARLPRMADFTRWSVAAEPAFGGPANISFLESYRRQREESHGIALEASVFGQIFLKWCESCNQQDNWLGTARKLLEELEHFLPEGERYNITRQNSWPKNARALSVLLHRLAPNMRASGVSLTFDIYSGELKRGILICSGKPATTTGVENHTATVNEEVASTQNSVDVTSGVAGTQTFNEEIENIEASTQTLTPPTRESEASTQNGWPHSQPPVVCVPGKKANFELEYGENGLSGTQNSQNSRVLQPTFELEKNKPELNSSTPEKNSLFQEKKVGMGEICVTSVPAKLGQANSNQPPVTENEGRVVKGQETPGQFHQFEEELFNCWEDYQGLQHLKYQVESSELESRLKTTLVSRIIQQRDRLIGIPKPIKERGKR